MQHPPLIYSAMLKFRLSRHAHLQQSEVLPEKKELEINDEIAAAIGMALHLHFQDVHDYEMTILTINQVMRPYSPWSSKIYGLQQMPNRIPRSSKY